MTEDEAATKITAGMKGMHTRSELAKGNAGRFADGARSDKIAARKQRIGDGTATDEDKAVNDAVCACVRACVHACVRACSRACILSFVCAGVREYVW